MTTYTFRDALPYSPAQLATSVNLCYASSYLPLQQTALEFARYCQYNSMDMGGSLLMYNEDRLVGSSLLATRGTRGWLGGFGIVPQYRGRGAGAALLAQQLAVARTLELCSLQVEVPLECPPARRLAQRSGLRVRRNLLDLLLTSPLPLPSVRSDVITTMPAEQLLDWLLQGQEPAWTRERINLAIKGGEALMLTTATTKAALMYRRRGAEGSRIQLYAAAHDPSGGLDALSSLLRYVSANAVAVSVHNEPEGTLLQQLCGELGFNVEHRYHEMRLEIEV